MTNTPAPGWELAVLGFEHPTQAEHAFADVRAHQAWMRDIAFVTMHHGGRVQLRGTFAGHYLDADDLAETPHAERILQSVREGVPDGGSALVGFGPAVEIDELVAAFASHQPSVTRHQVSAEEADALGAAVADAPVAAPSG